MNIKKNSEYVQMKDYLQEKIQKMKKTANGLQDKIESDSHHLSKDQINALKSLKRSTLNAIKNDKKELDKLRIDRDKAT